MATQPFGRKLFRGIFKAHPQFLAKTIMVRDAEPETAMRLMNKLLSEEGVLDIYRRTRYYEKPTQLRNRLSYERCKAIYNEDMSRKIQFLMRKHRADPWPGQY